MVSNIASRVRITTRGNAVWRECAGCDALVPLPANQTRCSDCRSTTCTPRRRPATRRVSGRN